MFDKTVYFNFLFAPSCSTLLNSGVFLVRHFLLIVSSVLCWKLLPKHRLFTLVVPVHCHNRILSTELDQHHTTLRRKNNTFKHQKPTYTQTHTHKHIFTHTSKVNQIFYNHTLTNNTNKQQSNIKKIKKYFKMYNYYLQLTHTVDTLCEFIRMYINMYRLNTPS